MPFINVKTNTAVTDEQKVSVKSGLGQAIAAIPGKSENWLMVNIEPEQSLYFKGSGEPAAMVEVGVYGSPAASSLNSLTGKICGLLKHELGIEPSRIYVKYSQTPDWGWNGSNF